MGSSMLTATLNWSSRLTRIGTNRSRKVELKTESKIRSFGVRGLTLFKWNHATPKLAMLPGALRYTGIKMGADNMGFDEHC